MLLTPGRQRGEDPVQVGATDPQKAILRAGAVGGQLALGDRLTDAALRPVSSATSRTFIHVRVTFSVMVMNYFPGLPIEGEMVRGCRGTVEGSTGRCRQAATPTGAGGAVGADVRVMASRTPSGGGSCSR